MQPTRRLRKGDKVCLKPGIFVLQKTGEVAHVEFVYRHHVFVSPSLNGHSQFSPDSLERVQAKVGASLHGPVTHIYISRPGPFGGTVHTTLCGRMALPTDKDTGAPCKLCRKKKAALAAIRAAKGGK